MFQRPGFFARGLIPVGEINSGLHPIGGGAAIEKHGSVLVPKRTLWFQSEGG